MRADKADIDALTKMRLEYIKADMGVSIEDEVLKNIRHCMCL